MRKTFVVFLLLFSTWASAQVKIAYVDMKQVLDKSPQMVAGRAKLEQEFQKTYQNIVTQEQHLKAQEEELQRNGPFLSAEKRDALDREIRNLRRTIRRDKEDYLDELNFRRSQELQKLQEKVTEVVRKVAQSKGYDLLISSPVIFASDNVDITQLIIDELTSINTTENENSQ
ncbi:MAG: OmpH family outer membrane protein [bacterium]